MIRRLVAALERRTLDRPPVWIMRQAGRYLPEYRQLRERHTFQEAVSTPTLASEITLQPIRRFELDGAVIFADIMTPLEAMGVDMTFDPGPRLRPHTLHEVASMPDLDLDRVAFVDETVRRVRSQAPTHVSVVGFAGAPLTLLAYLVQGGGSKDFMHFRGALRSDPSAAAAALDKLATAMASYLGFQASAGADVVQLFDSWAGLLDRQSFSSLAVPAAARSLSGLDVPTIYFAPGASHTLALQPRVGATGYGVDWRIPIDEAWRLLGDVSVQGNLDPAILLSDADSIRSEVADLLDRVGGRPGHIVNLGHGIDRRTPPENLQVLVDAIVASA